MTVTNPDAPVHLAGKRSREAAIAHDKQAWLDNFADDAIVEDPIGPSHFDPEGKGHRGKAAIAAFYDKAIAPSDLTFNFEKTFQCGNEEANVGHIVIRAAGYEVDRRGRVHLPGQRRGQDRCAAGILGARPRHRQRPQDLARQPVYCTGDQAEGQALRAPGRVGDIFRPAPRVGAATSSPTRTVPPASTLQ